MYNVNNKLQFKSVAASQCDHANNIKLHGYGLCCLLKECPKGTQAVPCRRGNHNSTSCKPCSGHTYMDHSTLSDSGERCHDKRICSYNSGKEVIPGLGDNDGSVNRRCRCMTQFGYYDKHYDPDDPLYSAAECLSCGNSSGYYVNRHQKCVKCDGSIIRHDNGSISCSTNTNTTISRVTTVPSVGSSSPRSEIVKNEMRLTILHWNRAMPLYGTIIIVLIPLVIIGILFWRRYRQGTGRGLPHTRAPSECQALTDQTTNEQTQQLFSTEPEGCGPESSTGRPLVEEDTEEYTVVFSENTVHDVPLKADAPDRLYDEAMFAGDKGVQTPAHLVEQIPLTDMQDDGRSSLNLQSDTSSQQHRSVPSWPPSAGHPHCNVFLDSLVDENTDIQSNNGCRNKSSTNHVSDLDEAEQTPVKRMYTGRSNNSESDRSSPDPAREAVPSAGLHDTDDAVPPSYGDAVPNAPPRYREQAECNGTARQNHGTTVSQSHCTNSGQTATMGDDNDVIKGDGNNVIMGDCNNVIMGDCNNVMNVNCKSLIIMTGPTPQQGT